ncbi:MAG: hemolysin III family protein, partial [Promethearchaeota archaeon]
MHIQKQEKFSSYSHLVGAVAAIIGTGLLIYISRTSISILITTIVYGFSVAFLFMSSFLYHAFKKTENEISFWR